MCHMAIIVLFCFCIVERLLIIAILFTVVIDEGRLFIM